MYSALIASLLCPPIFLPRTLSWEVPKNNRPEHKDHRNISTAAAVKNTITIKLKDDGIVGRGLYDHSSLNI